MKSHLFTEYVVQFKAHWAGFLYRSSKVISALDDDDAARRLFKANVGVYEIVSVTAVSRG
jgi:hypothetical protein